MALFSMTLMTPRPLLRCLSTAARFGLAASVVFLSFCLLLEISKTITRPSDEAYLDFTPRGRDELFLSIPNANSAWSASHTYANHPHLAGSTEDFEDAKSILQLFQSEFNIPPEPVEPIFTAGSAQSRNATLLLTTPEKNTPSAWIDVYYPLLNTPLQRTLQIIGENGNPVWTAEIEEDGDPLDEDASKYRTSVPAWHGFSRDAEVEGQLVYANYGSKEDYDELISVGTNLTGKIIITRSGRLFRGLKVKRAAELGAVGVLIYSDPRDDGFVTIENGFAPYPLGPARNPTAVERGSVQYLSFYPGDPTTPGYPAYKDAKRVEPSNIPTIPSLPISWKNAQRLLKEIDNLYFSDELGKRLLSGTSSLSIIKLINHVNTEVTPIWNTMAAVPGHTHGEVVIVGGHRDAWVLGAGDPISGTVSLHEVVRGVGALLRKGWKPLRTIVFTSWDAEEYGLIGSTEWGEDFADWLSQHAIAYINVDTSVSGSQWSASGSPSLADLIRQAALDVPHPTITGKTLWVAKDDQGPFTPSQGSNTTINTACLSACMATRSEDQLLSVVLPLGSGSDYTVFLQRLGIASSDEGFDCTPTDAVYHYHSIYDTNRFQEVYADPGFHRHVAVSQHLGLMALRLADTIIIPLNITRYALELDNYLDNVQEAPAPAAIPDFTALRNAIKNVQHACFDLDIEKQNAEIQFREVLSRLHGRSYGKCRHLHRLLTFVVHGIERFFGFRLEQFFWSPCMQLLEKPDSIHHRAMVEAATRVADVNQKLRSFEQGFLSEEGIRGRTWYKHLGVAPGKWLGYGATTFPALMEALTIDNNTSLAEQEAARLTCLLEQLATRIRA